MTVRFYGGGALAKTFEDAAVAVGCDIATGDPDVAVIALEVEDHDHTEEVSALTRWAIQTLPRSVSIIITSQVPPGWTGSWRNERLFYVPHTLIQGRHEAMAETPHVLAVGCSDPGADVPAAMQDYLDRFKCPILKMGYATAELAKISLNYILSVQIDAARLLRDVADDSGAWWDHIEQYLRLDDRIGPKAYVRPGYVGGHLSRDVKTVRKLAGLA